MLSPILKPSPWLCGLLVAALLGGQTTPQRPAKPRLEPPGRAATSGSVRQPATGAPAGQSAASGLAAQAFTQGPALSVDATANRHAISPDIYGINIYVIGDQTGMLNDLRLPVTRWGGDATSEYNWKLDKTNSGSDWYFEVFAQTDPTKMPGFNAGKLPDGSAFDRFHETNVKYGVKSVGTIPILDWVAGSFPDKTCGFSVNKYGNQQSADPYGNPDCGNGQVVVGANQTQAITSLKTTDPTDTDVQVDEDFMADWVRHVVGKYGTAAQGGVALWELDNEPVWWSGVHQSVHPKPSNYDEIVSRGLRYSAAVKSADPTALVGGPITAGWSDLFFSNVDLYSGWNSKSPTPGGADWQYWNNPVDRKAHGDLDFVAYYLQQFAVYEKQHGQRLLDYFDVHGYMPGTGGDATDSASQAARLQSTRVFWDPSYVFAHDDYLSNECVCLIPRMKGWVANNYPGLKLAITEYNLGALNTLNGGLAQADLLGVFGREDLDLATLWATVNSSDPAAFAFKLYRNYDGQGGAYGETSVSAVSDNRDQLSIYAAQRSDSALTLMVINKTAGNLSSNIALSDFQPDGTVQVWQYSAANLGAIVRQQDQSTTVNGVGANFPAYSATLLVVPEASSQKAPKPVISAIVNAATNATAIAPGTLVKITGQNLGPANGAPDPIAGKSGPVGTNLSGVRVLFNGTPAPVLSASSVAVLAMVPYTAATNPTSAVQVEYQNSRSDPFQTQIVPAAPGIFTADGTGHGPALAFSFDAGLSILKLNSPLNMAWGGANLLFYMTGAGVLNPPAVDGRIETTILPQPTQNVSVTIGGKPATAQVASAPGSVSGILLVNVTVPGGVTAGIAPLVVTVGNASSQSGVTLAVLLE